MIHSAEELTFQVVIDTILKPAGVKVGGYPQEMFLDLTEEEQEKWSCNICFMVVKDCHECMNKHIFCHSCIVAWTMTSGQNSNRCPLCRCEQTAYAQNRAVDRQLENKRVKCPHEDCWMTRAPLRSFLTHNHGRTDFSNADIDLESLQRQHVAGPDLLTPDEERLPVGARTGVLRGRMVSQQVRLILHLAFLLRHQAIARFSRATDPESRARAMDEVEEYSQQINEIRALMARNQTLANQNANVGGFTAVGRGRANTTTQSSTAPSVADPVAPFRSVRNC
ncbi:hypothetical protein NP493_603g01019 [Ridgeia piscesae]|uniref:RING-type domain-containing protein n=1 Tax=Ridgeia piscesae TaxID=27915 RepID=A0AAD9NP96_RIDPI|nr:hypothetical protein NP493_603g01019 [Ridgeia piscesae]